MAESVVTPVADPIIDTVHELELQALGFAEGVVEQTDIKPITDSAFSLARSVFDVQRDLSRKVVDLVDQAISSVTSAVEDAVPTPTPAPAKSAPAKKSTPKASSASTAGKSA